MTRKGGSPERFVGTASANVTVVSPGVGDGVLGGHVAGDGVLGGDAVGEAVADVLR